MTEPVTAADVMWAALCGFEELSPEEYIDALREACGGGDIVIRADGSLSALRPWSSINVILDANGRESCNHGDSVSCQIAGHRTESLYRVVPVERGA